MRGGRERKQADTNCASDGRAAPTLVRWHGEGALFTTVRADRGGPVRLEIHESLNDGVPAIGQ